MRRAIVAGLVLVALLAAGGCGGNGKKAPTFGGPPAGAPDAGAAYEPTGEIIADSGFRPDADGYAFQNYGDEGQQDLTPGEMRQLFGDVVCESLVDDECVLHPQAQAWMEETNAAMGGGHCYGFSVTTQLFYDEQVYPVDFGGNATADVPIQGNTDLQSFIAYGWAFQKLDSVLENVVSGTPNEILDALAAALDSGDESYTIAFFKRDGTGGHAVTPIAIEERDDGTTALIVYDNNYPEILRAIVFDREADTWQYDAAINPSEPSELYEGDADTKSLRLDSVSPGLDVQPCPFCAGRHSRVSAVAAPAKTQPYNAVFLTGDPRNHPHLLITDSQGHRLGYVAGRLVNEIPGARIVRPLMDFTVKDKVWTEDEEPEFRVPVGLELTVTIDGGSLKRPSTSSFALIGPGHDVVIDDIGLVRGQQDTLTLRGDGTTFTYVTAAHQSESPVLRMGVQGTVDHAFWVKALKLAGGSTITLALDDAHGRLTIDTTKTAAKGLYDIRMERDDKTGRQLYAHPGLELEPGETATLEYGKWSHHGQGIPLVTRIGGVERRIVLSD